VCVGGGCDIKEKCITLIMMVSIRVILSENRCLESGTEGGTEAGLKIRKKKRE